MKRFSFRNRFISGIGIFIACLAFGFSSTAQATLLGDTINGDLLVYGIVGNYFLPANGLVPAGACQSAAASSVISDPNAACGAEFQFENAFAVLNTDVSGDQVSITTDFKVDAILGGFFMTLSDLDWLPDPGFVTGIVELSDNYSGAGVVANFGSDSLSFDWTGGSVTAGTSFVATYQIAASHQVPAPATLALLGLGLLGLRLSRKA